MPYVKPEIIAEAKRMDLLTYLQNYEPNELVHVSGNVYCTKKHDSLRISNGLWCWYSRGIGGKSALDYLIKVNGYTFLEAVEIIAGKAVEKPPFFVPTEGKKEKALLLPSVYSDAKAVTNYLVGRCIDRSIIRCCIDSGNIYESRHYAKCSRKVYVNAVFLGFDKEGSEKYASLRGISTDFKGEATGSNKHYSFTLPAECRSDTVHLFESAIDLLSYATLMKLHGRDYKNTNLLSLAGVYQPKKIIQESKVPAALTQFLQDYPYVKRVSLHLDNDYAGRMATNAIVTVLPKQYVSQTFFTSRCKDVNDYLQLCLGKCPEKAKFQKQNYER